MRFERPVNDRPTDRPAKRPTDRLSERASAGRRGGCPTRKVLMINETLLNEARQAKCLPACLPLCLSAWLAGHRSSKRRLAHGENATNSGDNNPCPKVSSMKNRGLMKIDNGEQRQREAAKEPPAEQAQPELFSSSRRIVVNGA